VIEPRFDSHNDAVIFLCFTKKQGYMKSTSAGWRRTLSRKLLGKKSQEQVYQFIEKSIPPFEAPTDVRAWRSESARLRKAALERVFLRGYSKAVIDGKPKIVWGEVLKPDPSYVIRKLRYEIVPNYWIPALLYEPTKLSGKAPVMLNPNGHHAGGKAVDYKQARCANLARRGVIALNIEFIGMCELEADRFHDQIAQLNLVGQAGVGMFYLALKKGLDILLAHKNADASRCGVTGLSGGGWQTIIFSSLDPRVNLIVPVAGYTSVRARVRCPEDIGDMEQIPPDMVSVADYQELTAMLAPKPLLQIMNSKDECCFRTDRAKPLIYDAVLPVYRAHGAEKNIQFHSNTDPGTHNYGPDNRSRLYRFLSEQWGLSGPHKDIHKPSEIYRESELNVGLPEDQTTIMELALAHGRKIVKNLKSPRTAAERKALRSRLAEVVRLPEYRITSPVAMPKSNGVSDGLLGIGPWRVPVSIQFESGKSGAQLIVGDHGRAVSAAAHNASAGIVVAADILGSGELATDWQRHMLIETVGHRVIGVQAAQILACAGWLTQSTPHRRVTLVAEHWIAGVASLIAAAIEPKYFEELRIEDGIFPMSLLRVLDRFERYEKMPPLFCFGLLEVVDIPQMKALLEHVKCPLEWRAAPQ